MGAVAVGAGLGFLLMLAIAVASLRRSVRSPAPLPGVELLPGGASEWQELPSPAGAPASCTWLGRNARLLVSTTSSPFGSYWDAAAAGWRTTDELPPGHPMHPTVADTSWHPLPDGTWLTVRAGACSPVLEPSKTSLPAVPRCDPSKLYYRLASATRTGDGKLLLCVWHDDDSTSRAWQLAPGGSAWHETTPLPVSAVSGRLVPGGERSALLVGVGGEFALFDGESWRRLPRTRSDRIGWQAALAPDGSVLAAGSFPNLEKGARRARRAIVAALVVALFLAWEVLGLPPLALLLGLGIGVGGAVVAFFAVWIRLGVRF